MRVKVKKTFSMLLSMTIVCGIMMEAPFVIKKIKAEAVNYTTTVSRTNHFMAEVDTDVVSAGQPVKISYSDALLGTNQYINVQLINDSQEVVYEGHLADMSISGAKKDGSVWFTLPDSLENESYQMNVYSETCDEEEQTNIISPLSTINVSVVKAQVYLKNNTTVIPFANMTEAVSYGNQLSSNSKITVLTDTDTSITSDLTIEKNVSVTIAQDAKVHIGVASTILIEGSVVNNGRIDNQGKIENDGVLNNQGIIQDGIIVGSNTMIGRKAVITTIKAIPYSGDYDGLSHDAVTLSEITSYDKVYYSTNDIIYNDTLPTFKESSEIKPVYIKVLRNTNYMEWTSGPLTATIRNQDVTQVIDKINAIGSVTGDMASYNRILVARTAYNKLAYERRELVTNYSILEKAEERYVSLTGCHDLRLAIVQKIPAHCYTGKSIRPSVYVRMGYVVLKEGIDYQLSYENNVSTGRADVIITGIGLYQGQFNESFMIKAKSLSDLKVTGKKNINHLKVKYRGRTLKKGIDYVSVIKKKAVILRGQGNYTGTRKIEVSVIPEATTIQSIKQTGKSALIIKWSNMKNATRYEAYRSTKKNGTYKKVATVTGAKSYKDKKVKKKTTYYYYVIAGRKISNEVYYSPKSNTMKKLTK